ncbi:MAG: lysis system i-spanin subunit Rz, partial [Gloeotrichia echinulata HAB0833]
GRDEVTQNFESKMKELNLRHLADMKQMQIGFEQKNGKVIYEYDERLKSQADSYEKRIAGIRAAGGLRYRQDLSPDSTGTQTESAGANNEAGEYRLPERIEQGLFSLARKADEVKEQLNACQSWIKEQGFFNQ